MTAAETLPTTKKVQPTDKRNFIKVEFNENIEASVIYVSSLSMGLITIDLGWEAQITLLITEKVPVLIENTNFIDVFLKKSAVVLSERVSINEHVIKLVDSK